MHTSSDALGGGESPPQMVRDEKGRFLWPPRSQLNQRSPASLAIISERNLSYRVLVPFWRESSATAGIGLHHNSPVQNRTGEYALLFAYRTSAVERGACAKTRRRSPLFQRLVKDYL